MKKKMHNNRIIITGGPGTGKTSLLELLKEDGFQVVEEKARKVIKEQLEKETDLVPWDNLEGFSEILLSEILADKNYTDLAFFDRGIPDIMAYLVNGQKNIDMSPYLSGIKEMGYSSNVFYLPFWEEIYSTDSERVESTEEALKIGQVIYNQYLSLGFNVIEIPKMPLKERVEFLLSRI